MKKRCKKCEEWKKQCHLNDDDGLVYNVYCEYCGRKEETCWLEMIPDGWLHCWRVGIVCDICSEKFNDVLFDEENYQTLENEEW